MVWFCFLYWVNHIIESNSGVEVTDPDSSGKDELADDGVKIREETIMNTEGKATAQTKGMGEHVSQRAG